MRRLLALPVFAALLLGSGTSADAARTARAVEAPTRTPGASRAQGARRSWRSLLRPLKLGAALRRNASGATAAGARPAAQLTGGRQQIARSPDGKAMRAKTGPSLTTIAKRTLIGMWLATPSAVGFLTLGPIGVVVGPVVAGLGAAFIWGYVGR